MTLRFRCWTCGIVLTTLLLTSCTSWQVVPVSPRALVDSAHASSIQIQVKGGSKYVLDAPRLTGDSLTGTIPIGSGMRVPGRVALATIDNVAVKRPNLGKSLLVPLGIWAFAGVMVLMSGGLQLGY